MKSYDHWNTLKGTRVATPGVSEAGFRGRAASSLHGAISFYETLRQPVEKLLPGGRECYGTRREKYQGSWLRGNSIWNEIKPRFSWRKCRQPNLSWAGRQNRVALRLVKKCTPLRDWRSEFPTQRSSGKRKGEAHEGGTGVTGRPRSR